MSTTHNNNTPTTTQLANGTPLSFQNYIDSANNDKRHYLSVASFNLLAPIYVRPYDKRTGGIQPFAAFEWISDENSEFVLDMKHRGPRLLDSLIKCSADVICLQELQLTREKDGNGEFTIPKWLQPIITQHGYKIYLPPKEDLERIADRNVRVLDRDVAVTCAILIREDQHRFVTIAPSQKDNDDTNTSVSICLQPIHKADNKEEDVYSPLVVTCLHLDATDETKRVGQLSKCLKRAKTLSSTTSGGIQPISTIIAGDMNQEFRVGSCVTAFLDTTGKEVSEEDKMQQCKVSLRLADDEKVTPKQMEEWNNLYMDAQQTTYDYCAKLNRIPTGTTRSAYDHDSSNTGNRTMAQWKLDHILYTPTTLQPVANWKTLEDDVESCTIGLPNERIGSDHLPIGAIFELHPTPKLSQQEEIDLLATLNALRRKQNEILQEQEFVLREELEVLEARFLPKSQEEDNKDEEKEGTSQKKKKKKTSKKKGGPPPPEIMEFMRKRRSIIKELKAKQQMERKTLVETLGTLERLFMEQTFGYSARVWIERG